MIPLKRSKNACQFVLQRARKFWRLMADGSEDSIQDTVGRVAAQVLRFVRDYKFRPIVVSVLIPQGMRDRDESELVSRTLALLHVEGVKAEIQVWRDAAVDEAKAFVFAQRESEVKKHELDRELHSSDAIDPRVDRRRCAGTRLGWL